MRKLAEARAIVGPLAGFFVTSGVAALLYGFVGRG